MFIAERSEDDPRKLPYKMIPTRNGRFLLMLDGFTFSRQNKSNNFYCSKKDAGCKAKVKLTHDGDVIVAPKVDDHKHPRPVYLVKEDGTLMKVNFNIRTESYYWAHKPNADA